MELDRRQFVGVGAASFLTGCVHCAELDPIPSTDRRQPVGDAHVHLFNASDLPVRRFFEFVIIPSYLANFPEIALAVLDIAVRVLKAFAITAEQEQGNLLRTGKPTRDGEVGAEAFADRIADRIEEEVTARGFVPSAERSPESNLADSYFMLSLYLREAQARASGRPGQIAGRASDASNDRELYAQIARVDRQFLARIARQGRAVAGSSAAAARAAESAGCRAQAAAAADRDLGEIWAIVTWAFRMVHSRCRHVRDYLTSVDTGEAYCATLINLLVDYDCWLDDGPTEGSSHGQQVEFWTRYARHAAPRVAIHNFAGYDPLKHAEDLMRSRRAGASGRSLYFEELKSWFLASAGADRKVTGFKLYPPMGFNVNSNRGMHLPDVRAGAAVRGRWQREGWDIASIGVELDSALDAFFRFCSQHDVPMMAHGINSQCASPGSGAGASPHHWYRRALTVNGWGAGAKPLRACIGHHDSGPDFWLTMPKILEENRAGRSEIYFDLSYSTEFLTGDGPGLLREVARICEQLRDEGRYILFGTDWIMLAQEPNPDRYLGSAIAAAKADPFWRSRIADLFGGNLERFLTSASAS